MGEPEGSGETIWGRVSELGAFDGGKRFSARLLPEDDGPSVRVMLYEPPQELLAVLTLGARVACPCVTRVLSGEEVRVAHGIDRVQRGGARRGWQDVWCAPDLGLPPALKRVPEEAFAVHEKQVAEGAVRRRRVPNRLPPTEPPPLDDPQD